MIVYSLTMATYFSSFGEAGEACDKAHKENDGAYCYKMYAISQGFVVQVLDGSRNVGYIQNSR